MSRMQVMSVVAALPCAAAMSVAGMARAGSCDPLEQGRLTGLSGRYGASLSVSGKTAIAGAPGAEAARILESAGDGWIEVVQINEPFPNAVLFGDAVAIGGDTAVVGAPGRAFVFGRNAGGPGNWGFVAELDPASVFVGGFGRAVAIDGDTIVVGAPQGGPSNAQTGSAHVFERNLGGADAWGERIRLLPSGGESGWLYGASVSISGDTVAVGTPQTIFVGPGHVFIHGRNQGGPDAWGVVTTLSRPGGLDGEEFGVAVSLAGDELAVGALESDLPSNAGMVYLHHRDQGGPGSWGEVAQLSAPDGLFPDDFGAAVSLEGDTIAVGSPFDEPEGSVYVFARNHPAPGTWGYLTKLTGSQAGEGDQFGSAVAITSMDLLIGAPFQDSESSTQAGAVYAFGVDGPDCNFNGAPDDCDILGGLSPDADGNGVPDECESDCDRDGEIDALQFTIDPDLDCDQSLVLDQCELAAGLLDDFNRDSFPDACDPLDCDGNGIADIVEIFGGAAADCNGNLMIDGCETAQGLAWDDGVADLVIGSGFIVQPILWAIQFDAGSGAVIDAIHVALHDDGDIAVGDPITVHLWADPNNDGVPDDAVLLQSSVGTVQILGNGFDDDPEPYNVFPIEATRITGGFFVGAVTTTAQFPILGDEVPDPLIRGWGILSFDDPDAIQGAFPAFFGTYMVRAHAGLPCLCPADLDFDGEVGAGDLQLLLLAWGADPPGAADLDHNGVVDVRDLLALLAGWGACGSTP